MKKGLSKLYSGDFNVMDQDLQPDGSIIITLSSERYPEKYIFRVEHLYLENEKVLSHDIVEPGDKPWIRKRMNQAKMKPGDLFRGE